MLAVDLDDQPPHRLQQPGGNRLVVDEGTGAAIGQLHATQDDVLIVGDGVLAQRLARRMMARQLQHRHHLPALGPCPDQRRVATAAKRQRQRIEQDGFARTGLTGQCGKSVFEREIELVDQDNVSNRKRIEHSDGPSVVDRPNGAEQTRALQPSSKGNKQATDLLPARHRFQEKL